MKKINLLLQVINHFQWHDIGTYMNIPHPGKISNLLPTYIHFILFNISIS